MQKIDSVQETAQQFNALYEPKDKKYKAGKNITFAPDGYMTEEEVIRMVAKKNKQKVEEVKDLAQIFSDLKEVEPDLYEKIKEILSFAKLSVVAEFCGVDECQSL